jgi:hypothetical protein
MVLARVFAEMTVLIVLVALPIVLQLSGKLMPLPTAGKVVVIALALVALCILPWFGYITYQVNTDPAGLTTLALLARHACQWNSIKGLTRKSSHNWVRYVVEYEGGELSFPVLLRSCDVLVGEIRAHLPAGSGIAMNPYRMFKNDGMALVFQFLQAAAGILFVALFWFFCAGTVMKSGHNMDAAILVGFCLACTLGFLWRTFVVALMPKTVELTRDELIIRTVFFLRRYPWNDVLSVKQPFPLLPEGFMIKTKKGSYLVGTGMDAGDELQDAIKARIERKPA